MYFLKKDEENNNALKYIKECLQAHIDMKKEKEFEFLELYGNYQDGKGSLNAALDVEDEIKTIDNYSNAISYTYDYVNLMVKVKKHH